MNLLVISDCFFELVKSKEIDYIRWDDYHPKSLGGYKCVLIDMTFENELNRQKNKIAALYSLTKQIGVEFLSINDLILVAVCGSPNQFLEHSENINYLSYKNEKNPDPPIPFDSYDILKEVIPVYNRIAYEEGKHIYPVVVPEHINTYLKHYTSGTTFLCYSYDPKNIDFAKVTPLATIKENVNQCVAFECRYDRGLSVILPPYKRENAKEVFSILNKICNSYIKKRKTTYEATKIDTAVPESIRNYFSDAIICFKNNLYNQSVLTCRKALEASAYNLGIEHNITNLNVMINNLAEKKIIDSRLKELADLIRGLGNLGAHAPLYIDIQITEDDAINVIDFLKIFFDYVYTIPQKILDSKNKLEELAKRKKEG